MPTDATAKLSIFDRDLDRDAANFRALTPLSFLAWAAAVHPAKTALVHGRAACTYREMEARCRRLASALAARGVGAGDTVSVMAPNGPALLEAHYGVPMTGAVLNALNFRLDSESVAFILGHAETKVLIADTEFAPVVRAALGRLQRRPLVVDVADALAPEGGERLGEVEYEAFLAGGDPGFPWRPPADEWDAIALNYTSGTTGNPKGVVCHHRGAFLNALGNALVMGLGPDSVYLWTLPMFHCNGWSYTWAVTAVGATHVSIRRPDPKLVFAAIREHRVTHMCGAPIVLNMLIHAPAEVRVRFEHTVEVATGGAAPPSPVIEAMERLGFRVTHLYGLTETFGPASVCAWQRAWDALRPEEKAAKMARQGVRYPTLAELIVADPATLRPVPADGASMGEVMVRGNTVMKGYLKNGRATAEAFAGGWFRTGDLGVLHPDGYMEVKDRSKDIIISGGENISSLEVEEALYRHPKVMEAAVVARPDERWGETPCAFVALKPEWEGKVEADDIVAWCRGRLAHFKVPKTVVFGPLPKTSTGKIQKFVLRERAKAL
jgi:fatty-acyl-CoA synthase